MRHHPILLIVVLGSVLCFGRSYGQVNSPAFDPNCYFPRIGVPGEIDTIYGAHPDQYLGDGMQNIGPLPGQSYGRILCTFDHIDSNNTYEDSLFASGPLFNLHKLQVLGKFINVPITRRGHFRSPKYLDILSWDPAIWGDQVGARIYWQDDQGNFDSSRYTELTASIKGKKYSDYSFMKPYSAHISSDTVDDIIYDVLLSDSDTIPSYFRMLYFKGGEKLFNQGKIATDDSSILFGNIHQDIYHAVWGSTQGDFRGTGREDLIIADYAHNFFYYKNEKPFSLSFFTQALLFDTIFSTWENPNIYPNWSGFAMHVFPKVYPDTSVDFLLGYSGYRIFKGGADFGSHRLTINNPSFLLHPPSYYDSHLQYTWGSYIRDCGDMTGTGNHVLYANGVNGLYSFSFFYVLGTALDDKVDMYIDAPTAGYVFGGGALGNVDTLTADNDRFQDILIGVAGYGKDNADATGSIYLVHGSSKIPVAGRGVNDLTDNFNAISIYPNPVTNGKCTLNFGSIEQQDLQINIRDLLGRKVYSEHIYAPFMRPMHQIVLHSFPSGTYILEVTGKNFSQRIQLSVLK